MRERNNKSKIIILSCVGVIIVAAALILVFSGALGGQKKEEKTEENDIALSEKTDVQEIEEEILSEIHEGGNCTEKYGKLMIVNPNFTVTTSWIDNRKGALVSLSKLYGIEEGHSWNGDNLIDAEAAEHLNDMVKAYEVFNNGHTMVTNSCYRARGMNCGRMCAATGESDHHAGYTCDLIDPSYGESLDTDDYDAHKEWQWLRANSYKYGFIDRFPEAWAGGTMLEPLNVDENGTTGLFETWHYRYVGVKAATEIAEGKYNDGKYDSLEHYMKATGRISDLKNGKC